MIQKIRDWLLLGPTKREFVRRNDFIERGNSWPPMPKPVPPPKLSRRELISAILAAVFGARYGRWLRWRNADTDFPALLAEVCDRMLLGYYEPGLFAAPLAKPLTISRPASDFQKEGIRALYAELSVPEWNGKDFTIDGE